VVPCLSGYSDLTVTVLTIANFRDVRLLAVSLCLTTRLCPLQAFLMPAYGDNSSRRWEGKDRGSLQSLVRCWRTLLCGLAPRREKVMVCLLGRYTVIHEPVGVHGTHWLVDGHARGRRVGGHAHSACSHGVTRGRVGTRGVLACPPRVLIRQCARRRCCRRRRTASAPRL